MARIFLFIAILPFFYINSIQAKVKSFEGNINFVRETVFDTTFISISVKGDMARVEEFDSKRMPLITHIINLKEEQVFAISNEKKVYTKIPVRKLINCDTSNLEYVKTGNHKEINGRTCYQWRVRDLQRNTEIAYWVFNEEFEFLSTLFELLNRTEYSFSVYNVIPDSKSHFPMLTEERTLLRKNMLRIVVVEINEKNLSQALFEIPRSYQLLSR